MDIFTRKPCLTSDWILSENLNSSPSHQTLPSHFLLALSFSVRWIKLAVDFDYLQQLTQRITIIYLLVLYGVFHTPFFPGPLLQLITVIQEMRSSVWFKCLLWGLYDYRLWTTPPWKKAKKVNVIFPSLVVQLVKNPPAMQDTWVLSLGGKTPWRRERLSTPYSGLENSMD